MSNTPETEKAERMAYSQEYMVPTEFARKLERERDEAMGKYATEATEHMLAVNKVCNERDEAREVLRAVIKTGKRLERERDEAREHLKLSAVWQGLRDSQDEVLRLTLENRELRNLSNE